MKIKLIDYGYKNAPMRAHSNDAGADVYSTIEYVLKAHESKKIPLGLGIRLPDGYVAFVCPRSGLSSKGITCELAPIDSGYTGEIHAIVTNNTNEDFVINCDDRIGQLVVMPVIICDFIDEKEVIENERGANGFGSTGH